MIHRRTFVQTLAVAASGGIQAVDSAVQQLARASDWELPDSRIAEIAAIYKGIADSTQALRAADLGLSVPATVFEAD